MTYSLRSLDANVIVLWGFCGAIVSGGIYTLYGLAYEGLAMPPIPPGGSLSYGQQAGVMAVVIGCLGACVGISVVIARFWSGLIASAFSIAASVAVALFVELHWMDSVRRYGADPSDNIVFVPPLFSASLVFVWGTALVVATFVCRLLKYSLRA